MRNFSPGLFDRLAEPEPAPASRQQARAQAQQRCRDSITRDLVALLNTRSAMQADTLKPWPAVRSSVRRNRATGRQIVSRLFLT